MATCKKIVRKIERVCVGSLNKRIKLKVREIIAPTLGSVDFGESFSDIFTTWAMVNTLVGVEVFDGSNTAQSVSHEFYIRYIPGVTFEDWIEYNGSNYDILKVENLNEESRFLRFRCNLRGAATQEVNFA